MGSEAIGSPVFRAQQQLSGPADSVSLQSYWLHCEVPCPHATLCPAVVATANTGTNHGMKIEEERNNHARREFVKKAAYVAPAIVTLAVRPSYAKTGSEKPSGGTAPPTIPPQLPDPTSFWAWLLKLLRLA